MSAREQELKAWMIAGLEGDGAAHAALLRALVPLLRAYFRRHAGDAGGDLEDMVQETLIAVHERRSTFDRNRPFSAWLYAIARYKLIDRYRRLRIHAPLEDVEDWLAEDGFEDAANARMDVDRLLTSLPARQANMIRATRIEGMSVADAALAGGIGESNVKVSVHRGLKTLVARIRGTEQ